MATSRSRQAPLGRRGKASPSEKAAFFFSFFFGAAFFEPWPRRGRHRHHRPPRPSGADSSLALTIDYEFNYRRATRATTRISAAATAATAAAAAAARPHPRASHSVFLSRAHRWRIICPSRRRLRSCARVEAVFFRSRTNVGAGDPRPFADMADVV